MEPKRALYVVEQMKAYVFVTCAAIPLLTLLLMPLILPVLPGF